ncbi:Kif17, partial [Symbiodinium pilosum]
VASLAELEEVLRFGWAQSAATRGDPSKKDIVVTLTLQSRSPSGDLCRRKLTLVKCRGCEKVAKTGATGERLQEGALLAQSSASLGRVIIALTSGSRLIPYRDGQLTRLLTESLGGNTKTIWIAHVLPVDYAHSETLAVLRLANRVASIVNKPLALGTEPPDPTPCVLFAEATWLRR